MVTSAQEVTSVVSQHASMVTSGRRQQASIDNMHLECDKRTVAARGQ
jgi:hypothetical protein